MVDLQYKDQVISLFDFEFVVDRGNVIRLTPAIDSDAVLKVTFPPTEEHHFKSYYRSIEKMDTVILIFEEGTIPFAGRWMETRALNNPPVVMATFRTNVALSIDPTNTPPPPTVITELTVNGGGWEDSHRVVPSCEISFEFNPGLFKYLLRSCADQYLLRAQIGLDGQFMYYTVQKLKITRTGITVVGTLKDDPKNKPFIKEVKIVDLPQKDIDYYAEYWGFNPGEYKEVGTPSSGLTIKKYQYEWFGTLAPPFEKIQIGARVVFDKEYNSKNRIVFRQELPRVRSGKVEFMGKTNERTVDCTHTAVMQAAFPGLGHRASILEEKVLSSENFSEIRKEIPPWEHFVALKSYVQGIRDIGLREMMTLSYYPVSDDSTETLAEMSPVGFNALMQKQVIEAINGLNPVLAKVLVRDFLIDLSERAPVAWFVTRFNLLQQNYGARTLLEEDRELLLMVVENLGSWIKPLREVWMKNFKINTIEFSNDDFQEFVAFFERFEKKYGKKKSEVKKVVSSKEFNDRLNDPDFVIGGYRR